MSEDRSTDARSSQTGDSYDTFTFKLLSMQECIRKRPEMYLGSTSQDGLQQMLFYSLGETFELAAQGLVKHIEVRLHADGSCTVADDGPPPLFQPGLPEDNLLLRGLTLLRNQPGAHDRIPPKMSLHGIDLPVVNVLSKSFLVEVRSNGQIHRQEYRRGIPRGPAYQAGRCEESGVRFTFRPDPTVFSTTEFDRDRVRVRLLEFAYCHNGLRIVLEDEFSQSREQFQFADGIGALCDSTLAGHQLLYPEVIRFNRHEANLRYEIAFSHSIGEEPDLRSYAKGARTCNGGTHQDAFCAALSRSLRSLLRNTANFIEPPSSEHFRAGLIAVVAIWVPEPRYTSDRRARLMNFEIETPMRSSLSQQMRQYWDLHPEVAHAIVQKAQANQARAHTARRQREQPRSHIRYFPGREVNPNA